MSSYGYPTPEQGPPPSAYARDRFWSSPPTTGGGGDPWGSTSNSYTPQLELSSFSNSNYSPYGQPQNGIGPSNSTSTTSPGSVPGQHSDLTFSGPSPPNPTQLQPISYPPPPSPCRGGGGGYTPSSTPTPLTPKQTNGLNGGTSHNNHSSSSASNSPPNNGLNNNNNNSRSFSYLEDGPQNPTSMQNGHPSNNNGGPSPSTLLSLGGNGGNPNKNEMINGSHPSGGGEESMYRSLGIKSEPGTTTDYQYQHQSYYQNYTPTTPTTGQGGGGGYPPQNHNHHPYYQENNSSTPSYNTKPSYDPYQQQHHQQQQQNIYSQQSPYSDPHHHQQDYSNYGGSSTALPPNPSSSSSPPEDRKPSPKQIDPLKLYDYPSSEQHRSLGYDSITNSNTSPPSSYRSFGLGGGGGGRPANNNGPTTTNSPPTATHVKIEDHHQDKRISPTNNNNTTSSPPDSHPHPLPPPKAKNGKEKGKKGNSFVPPPPPPPIIEDKKEFPPINNKNSKDPPPPAKKKRKKRTKPGESFGNNKVDVKKDGISDFPRGIKEEVKEGGGGPGKGKKGTKLHLQQQQILKEQHDDDLLLDLEDSVGGAAGCDYDDEDSKHRSSGDLGKDVPMVECGCFPADEVHAEPGPFYTHLGAAQNLAELRKVVESRTGFRGNQVRLEKVIYTGKEGKTSVGCPLAKWILRRGSFEEQLLFLVKHRKGHKCTTAWIVVCCVIWEGVPPHFSDNLYDTLVYKLNRFGIPTTRRSDTNEQRSCACQGVDPDTCGAAYSFGCAWSMFFNGCKYARSRNVRKFRLTEEHEESELEEKVQHLATHLAPLYERVAQDSYTNQIDHENEGLECRLGYRPGRPFSGVTACLDYCSHAHKDAHNMMNGATATVSLARHRTLSKPDDEQYHVLPLYKLDDTDEYGSKEGQKSKIKKGQLEILKKYPCKVRIRKVPLLPSRRRAKAKSSPGAGGSNSNKGGDSSNSAGSTPAPQQGTAASSKGVNQPGGGGNSLLGGDYSSDMPPSKREKIFDERLSNGVGDGYGSGELRFQGYGLGQTLPSGLGHSFNDLGGPTPGGTPSLWNTPHFTMGSSSSPNTGANPSARGLSHPTSSSSSYFDHSTTSSTLPPGSGSSLLCGTSSSLSSLTELTNSTISRHGSSSSGAGGGSISSSSSTLLSSPGSSGGNPGSASSSGYSSMSPILPSFRNTFMTEAESLGLSSSDSNVNTASSSSPRSGPKQLSQSQQQHSQHLHQHSSSTPAFQDHTSSAYGSSGGGSGSYPTSSPLHHTSPYSSNPPPGGLYHPQPHNPCLPPSHHHNPYHHHHHSSPSQHNPYHHPHHDPSSSYHIPTPSFTSTLGGWSSAAAAAAAYSSNYAAAAYSSYPGLQPPSVSNFGMNISHHHQYSPYHHATMGPTSNMNMPHHIPPSRGNPTPVGPWGQGHTHQFNPFSAAAGTPLPQPSMGMNMNLTPQGPPPPPSCFVTPPKPKVIPEVNESSSDNEDCFKDPAMGGVAIALTHGSVILQCAKHEMHATTALKNPNRMYPSRICLIFYQHKSMNNRFHGWSEWEKKIEAKKLQEVKLINQGKMEASPRKMKQLIKEGYIQDSQ